MGRTATIIGPSVNLEYARRVLKAEAKAVQSLARRIGPEFERAVRLILGCKGKVVATGMGKAGIIAQKISATLASTGTPSIFLHPAEAMHGDLGRIVKEDVVLALSNSGETSELIALLPSIRELGARIVSITASASSSLAKTSDVVLTIGDIEEPCPMKLAPSASTTAMLALGDALALTVLRERGFSEEDYAFFHPGGALGKRLKKVSDIMRTGERNPVIDETRPVKVALELITRSRAGAISVVNGKGRLTGIFTDGDLRRHVAADPDVLNAPIKEVMTRNPITISPDKYVYQAAEILGRRKIDELPVVDARGRPIGMLDVQDLLDLGII